MKLRRVLCLLLAGLCGSCGAAATTFPNQLRDGSGNPIILDDVEAIVSDDDLTEEEKREQLGELGIEDEELIDALLTL